MPFKITIRKKGLRLGTVRKLVKQLQKSLGDDDAEIDLVQYTVPKTRPERFSAAMGDVANGRNELSSLKDELEEWKNNIPENLQDGAKAEELDEAISALDDAVGALEEVEEAEVTFPGMF